MAKKNFFIFFRAIFLLAVFLSFSISEVFAAVTVVPASGGSAISADTTGGAYTSLTGPVITEGVTADIGTGTIILNAPAGFNFNTAANSVTAARTDVVGTGCNNPRRLLINGGISQTVTPTATTITISITKTTSSSCRNVITWSGIQVRPIAGTPLASGNITKSGTSSISGVTDGVTNFGTLTEIAGAKNKLTFITQPSSAAIVNTDFAIKPVIKLQDQFGNTVTSDSTSIVSRTAVLSTQTCGGTAGSGILTSTPANNSAVTAGILTYTAMQYSYGESIKICVTSTGVTSALSNTITVSNSVPTTTNISPTTKTVGDPQFTLTVNGTNFVVNSIVQFNGSSRVTTYVSSTQLTAIIPSTDLTIAGTHNITVFNPTPGGGTSNAQTFTVNLAPDTTAPAAITNLSLSNPTTSSIDVSWTAPGDDGSAGTATTYDLRYSTSAINSGNFSSATQVAGEPTPSVAGSAESMTVTGLNSSTIYYFALETSDEALNVSDISNVPSLETLATPPGPDIIAPAAVTDLTLSNPTTSSITASWTAPGDDDNTGVAAGYDLRYSESLITAGNFDSAMQVSGEPAPNIAGTNQSAVVGGLLAGTTYYFALKTSDEVPNVSGISNVPSLATAEIPKTSPVVPSGSGSSVAPTRVIFSGRAYPDGKIRIYRRSLIESVFANTYLPNSDIEIDSEGNFSKTFTAILQSNYLFAVEAEDKNGQKSGVLGFTANLLSNNELKAENLFLPPTINFSKTAITKGQEIKISGYAYPDCDVELVLDNTLRYKTKSDSEGYYQLILNTQRFSPKLHFVAIRQIDKDSIKSDFSLTKTFSVSLLNNPQTDLNADGKVDVTDWSMFLSRWKSTNINIKIRLDFNLDGKVDVVDFSIFLKSIKGL
ncbi:MAG: fibronectin type III domain-containing protein [Candidatus Pacebacteria bacterium]|nr:fibronectin type III domain-containing protein [Candidatus Paceibacterota bacterium]